MCEPRDEKMQRGLTLRFEEALILKDEKLLEDLYEEIVGFYGDDVIDLLFFFESFATKIGQSCSEKFLCSLQKKPGFSLKLCCAVMVGAREDNQRLANILEVFNLVGTFCPLYGVFGTLKHDVSVFKETALIIYSRMRPQNFSSRLAKHKVPQFSGWAVVSSILPSDFDYHSVETSVKIEDGILVHGTVGHFSSGGPKSIFAALTEKYGLDRGLVFLEDLFFIGNVLNSQI